MISVTDKVRKKNGYPVQLENYDLSRDPNKLRQTGKTAPNLLHGARADRRDPADIMRQMGFDPSIHMTPLQFLIAVMNDDLDAIFKSKKRRNRMEGKGGFSINYRIECAKTAARYLHMELPKITLQQEETTGFGESLSEAIALGNERVRTRRMIVEEIEQISPDLPLAPASYPPIFQESAEDADIGADRGIDHETDAG